MLKTLLPHVYLVIGGMGRQPKLSMAGPKSARLSWMSACGPIYLSPAPDETWEPFITSFEPKVSFRYQGQKTYSVIGFIWDNLISCLEPKIIWILYEYVNSAFGKPEAWHHIGKLKGFANLLFEAFMRAYFDANMKLLYPLCLVRQPNL